MAMEEEMMVEADPRWKPAKPKACACWFATIGPDANNTITAAIAVVLKAIPVFEFINVHYR